MFSRRYPQRYTIKVTKEMSERLEQERERCFLESVPETIRKPELFQDPVRWLPLSQSLVNT